MARPKRTDIEYRNYKLPAYFPIIILTGEHWRISDKKSSSLHFHNCLEIGICETDSGFMEFSNEVREFKKGDTVIIGCDVPHTTYSTKGCASKWTYLYVNVEELLNSHFPLDLISDRDSLKLLLRNYWNIFDENTYPDVAMLAKEIAEDMKNKENNFQYSVRGLVLSLTIRLINIYNQSDPLEKNILQEKDNSLVIAPAIEYIRQNYMLDFSMEELANMCNISPSHFRRTFTSIMGYSSMEYLIRMRINNAAIQIRTTDDPILTISENVGFHSVSSFNRHFSEIFGTTPMKYRKQMSCTGDNSFFKCNGWMTPPQNM